MTAEKNLSPALGLILIAAGIFIAVSLVSYHPGDAGHAQAPGTVLNYGGRVGAWLSLYLFLSVGTAAFAIPVLIMGEGIARLIPLQAPPRPSGLKLLYEVLMIGSLSPLLSLQNTFSWNSLSWLFKGWQLEKLSLGGWWGGFVSTALHNYLGLVGTRLVLVTVFVVSGALLTEMRPLLFMVYRGRRFLTFLISLLPSRRRVKITPSVPPEPREVAVAEEFRPREKEGQRERQKEVEELKRQKAQKQLIQEREREKEERKRLKELERQERKKKKLERRKPPEVEKEKKPPVPRPAIVSSVSPPPSRAGAVSPPPTGPYQLPSVDLLKIPPPLSEREIEDDIEVNSQILESTLLDFGLDVKVVGAERGPTITRYELQPAPGVKVGKIKALDNDIALAMKATSVRILAPIPGKAALGIEVPNPSTTLVYIREMIESVEYQKGSAILPLALGKDISGRPIIADLTEMPHLLIAGATGSGKTVCMNSIIISLLFSQTPDEMRFILVDPKRVEMSAFNHLPHLLCPAVTDATKTSLALAWLVKEMEGRYELFARAGVRNIEGYNNRQDSFPEKGEEGEELPPTIPYILLMIDELADLMLTAPTEIENAIARLAHLSRAVGIHMILATQRPSVDVITGVIKANFPARISFRVAAKVDSRTVLDAGGADKLLGNGDLLFLPPASDRMIRAQGTICHDSEIEAVVGFVNRQREPQYDGEIFQKVAKGMVALGGGEDILLEASVEVIKQTEQASVSILQRKLKIGYSRAARIMDILEERGIVGPYQGTKAREILIETYGGEGRPESGEEEEE